MGKGNDNGKDKREGKDEERRRRATQQSSNTGANPSNSPARPLLSQTVGFAPGSTLPPKGLPHPPSFSPQPITGRPSDPAVVQQLRSTSAPPPTRTLPPVPPPEEVDEPALPPHPTPNFDPPSPTIIPYQGPSYFRFGTRPSAAYIVSDLEAMAAEDAEGSNTTNQQAPTHSTTIQNNHDFPTSEPTPPRASRSRTRTPHSRRRPSPPPTPPPRRLLRDRSADERASRETRRENYFETRFQSLGAGSSKDNEEDEGRERK